MLTSFVNRCQLTFIDFMLTFVIMTSCLIFRHGWCQLTPIDLTRQLWCFLTPLTFFEISKNFNENWRKRQFITSSIDINRRQFTSAKVIWRQLTSIDVKWLQTWCLLTLFMNFFYMNYAKFILHITNLIFYDDFYIN